MPAMSGAQTDDISGQDINDAKVWVSCGKPQRRICPALGEVVELVGYMHQLSFNL